MKNKVILITGSSTGFGRLSSEVLSQNSHIVYASMRDISSRNKKNSDELLKWASNNKVHLKTIEL
jgi:NADP-dependent 3-hydroxy acid dehydrogenase YdfG